MPECKRHTVVALGYAVVESIAGEIMRATNGGGECSGEVGNCGCTHAEINLLKIMPRPYRVWVSHSPCIDCAKALVASGVEMVEYDAEYRIRDGIFYLLENGIFVRRAQLKLEGNDNDKEG